jgi:hypothetical protein
MTSISFALMFAVMLQIPEDATSVDDYPSMAQDFDRSNTAVRLLAETTGALAGATITFAALYYLVALPRLCTPPTENCEVSAWHDPLNVAVLGLGPGAWLGGKLAGGQSDWWPPLAGLLVGAGLSIGADLVFRLDFPTDGVVYYCFSLLGAVAGAEIGHFLEVVPRPAATVAPLIGPRFRGIALIWRI